MKTDICSVVGCNNKRTSKGNNSRGKRRYRAFCSTHYKQKLGRIDGLSTDKCSICAWIGPCDKHRLVFGMNGGRYTADNITVLCPNCHRLVHMGKLILK